MRLAAADVIGADDEQAGVFALCAGIWLQRDRVITGDLAKLRGKIRDQLGVALGLVRRHEGVDVGELRPGMGIISAVALSFIVQEPSGIMLRSRARSRSESRRI